MGNNGDDKVCPNKVPDLKEKEVCITLVVRMCGMDILDNFLIFPSKYLFLLEVIQIGKLKQYFDSPAKYPPILIYSLTVHNMFALSIFFIILSLVFPKPYVQKIYV